MPDFVDVLPLLDQAASSLRHNELIQSEHITLFETTSAIEIGEPRMDTGVYTQEELKHPGLDVFKPLMPPELLYVMDDMLSLEMQFHQGYALAQTVFTCGYIHQLEQLDLEDVFLRRIEDKTYPVELMTVVLRSFLRGGLKTCDILMEELIKGHTYDNEDFVSDKGGMTLLEDVEIDTVLEELNEASDFLMAWTGDLADEWRVPLLTRLRLRTEMLCAVCLFALDPPLYEHVKGHTEAVRQCLDHMHKRSSPRTAVSGAFNPYLGKHLDSLAPPRPSLSPMQPVDALRIFTNLLDGLDGAVRLTGVEDWLTIEETFLDLGKRDDVLPYIRSLYQTVFYRDRMFCGYRELAWVGRAFLTDVAGGTIDLWNLIDTYAEGDPQQLSVIHRLMGFSGQVAWRLLDYIAYLGKNRSRQYRKLPRMLEAMARLEEQAREFQPQLQELLDHFGIAYDTKKLAHAFLSMQAFLRAHVILTGFDLELYSQNELATVHWYLFEVTKYALRPAVGNQTKKLMRQRAQTLAVYHHLAAATCKYLAWKGSSPFDRPLDKTLFKRRLKWAMQEDTPLQPDWNSFVAQSRNLATQDSAILGRQIREHCQAGESLLNELAPEIAAPLLQACKEYRSRIEVDGSKGLVTSPLSKLLPFFISA